MRMTPSSYVAALGLQAHGAFDATIQDDGAEAEKSSTIRDDMQTRPPATAAAIARGSHPFHGDPYARYQALRLQGPIHWTPDLFGGAWLLTTFDGVQAALKDPRLSAQRTGGWVMRHALRGSPERKHLTAMQRLFARAMLFVDKPAHPRLRSVMQHAFRPARIEALRGQVAGLVHNLIGDIERRIPATASFDFIEHFATPLPSRVVSRFLGLRMVDDARFLSWSSGLAAFLGAVEPTADETRAAHDSLAAMSDEIDRRIRADDLEEDGLIASLVEAQAQGRIESREELLAQCVMLLFAGHETTRHLLGTAVYWLLQEPGRWRTLEDPARVRTSVRELLRWDSPVQFTGRRANCDFDLFGVALRRGDLVLPLLGSANRDPARYGAANHLDLDRQLGMPLSFGSGPHVCIGAALTLMEAECALGELVRRWPGLQMAEHSPPWIEAPLYRGLRRLELHRGTSSVGVPPAHAHLLP
ncbi:cytochrome P450 [Roseateles sp. LKC17W]|uniref:Cytochrome P450 n=1 Tax=Pelomonas margarita TaxID=3299031 RepID=A0ABW7FEV1_9BURK